MRPHRSHTPYVFFSSLTIQHFATRFALRNLCQSQGEPRQGGSGFHRPFRPRQVHACGPPGLTRVRACSPPRVHNHFAHLSRQTRKINLRVHPQSTPVQAHLSCPSLSEFRPPHFRFVRRRRAASNSSSVGSALALAPPPPAFAFPPFFFLLTPPPPQYLAGAAARRTEAHDSKTKIARNV